ncbi:glycosyltransferase [Gottfriedia sp. S16(2024)]|uniref:glycosyltransferase family 4 protein n=1 Tax=Gottfriedia sp. S16(2024) TaxID=3162883 RepID=UPI003D23F5E0
MKVGYILKNYPELRNIIGKVNNTDYVYDSKNNLFQYSNKIKKLLNSYLGFKYSGDELFKHKSVLNLKQLDFYHFFNHISYGNKPYITTFETVIPRTSQFLFGFKEEKNKKEIDSSIVKEIEVLDRDTCKKLIAISECTKEFQFNLLNNFEPKLAERIKKKIIVLHPPQELLINSYKEKFSGDQDSEAITFVFVGRHFHQKGGYESVVSFDRLCKKHPNLKLKLIIIGNVQNTEDSTKIVSLEDIRFIENIIGKNKNIELKKEMPNLEVLEIFKLSHIGLLPTWADTYGYSVLEMQAAGCPVITTNVRALPEINNDEVGWLIDLPLNDTKEAVNSNESDKSRIRETIISSLYKIMSSIVENPESIEQKGINSLKRIKEEHNPDTYAQKIQSIYEDII